MERTRGSWIRGIRSGWPTARPRCTTPSRASFPRRRSSYSELVLTSCQNKALLTINRLNLFYGLDLPTWIKDGSVDMIIPYSSVPGLNSAVDSFDDPRAADFFLRITRGTSCKAAFNIMPRQLSAETYRTRAHRLYEAGAEHLFFWDCNGRHDYSPAWSALRRLGHREEIAVWVRAGAPQLARPGSNLRRLGDWDLSYVTPG